MINIEQDFIKKSRVKYLKCKQGGLHEGEIMNFICIDPVCKSKGLICPVCQSCDHDGHNSMHLKIFLSELGKQLGCGQDEVAGVSDYLRKLQSSKREMLNVLKDTVEQIAEKVKKVEKNIHDVYYSVRRSVLTQVLKSLLQSALGTKLPKLYELLTSEKDANQNEIGEQISKCSELLEYKNKKIYAIDSTQKLIEDFSNIASAMSVHLSTMVPELTKLFDSLPIRVKKFGGKEDQAAITSLEFSKNHKPANIKLSENLKAAQIEGEDVGGVTFVENTFSDKQKVKIAFKITECFSDCISLGIGNPEAVKSKGYKIDETDNSGLFGLCSMGFVFNDFDNPTFVFATGDIIDIEWDVVDVKISFSRRNGLEKYELFPEMTLEEAKKMTFFAILTVPGDKVELVD